MFCTPLIVMQVLDLGSARVFITLVEIKVKVAPESRRALATMVLPVGPVRSTWLVISRLLGMMLGVVVLMVAVEVWVVGSVLSLWTMVLCFPPQTLHLYSDLH